MPIEGTTTVCRANELRSAAVRTATPSPQAIIEVRFRTAEEGGRQSVIYATPDKNFYSCPMGLDGEYFDCRVYLEDEAKLEPGGTYQLPVRFLNPLLVLPRLLPGKEIKLSGKEKSSRRERWYRSPHERTTLLAGISRQFANAGSLEAPTGGTGQSQDQLKL